MKLGLNTYRPDERDIPLDAVYQPPRLPEDPSASPFGVRGLDWGVLGNDEFGDCFWAAAAHETMTWAYLAGRRRNFVSGGVLRSYADYLGVDEVTEANDEGTYPDSGARFRRKYGVLDGNGTPARAGAYAFITKPSDQLIRGALYDFGAVNLCVDFPASAWGADTWDYVEGAQIDGGHSVALTGVAETGNYVAVSWGREYEVTPAFIENYLQCVIVFFSASLLLHGLAPDGLDKRSLLARLEELTA